jgi:hypothetical protein
MIAGLPAVQLVRDQISEPLKVSACQDHIPITESFSQVYNRRLEVRRALGAKHHTNHLGGTKLISVQADFACQPKTVLRAAYTPRACTSPDMNGNSGRSCPLAPSILSNVKPLRLVLNCFP